MQGGSVLSFEQVVPSEQPLGKTFPNGLLVDGRIISNAVDRVDWSAHDAALNLCTHCGEPTCGLGPDTLIRSLGELLVLQPLLTEQPWSDESFLRDLDRNRYRAIYLGTGSVEAIRNGGANIRAASKYPELEVVWARRNAWLAAPKYLVGGTPREPIVNLDHIYACSSGEPAEHLDQYIKMMKGPLKLCDSEDAQPVDFFIGEPYWSEVQLISTAEGRAQVMLSSELPWGLVAT